MEKIVDVRHECRDGWHKFTSPQIPGLYLVAEQSHLEEVYGEIPEVIAAIVCADFNEAVDVKAVQSYSEYQKGLPQEYRPEFTHFSIQRKAA